MRVLQPEPFARDWKVEDHAEPHGFDEPDGRDGEEDATQAKHRKADEDADDAGEHDRDGNVEHERRAQAQLHQHGRVCADGHERRRGQRKLAGIQDEEHRRRDDAVDPDLRDQQCVRAPEPDRVVGELEEEVHDA